MNIIDNTSQFHIVENKVIDRWLPLIEGTGKFKYQVADCPKVPANEVAIMAQCLENIKNLSEGTTSANTASTDYKALYAALTRRVMPSLLGPKIFGYQPMKTASEIAYAQRAVFGGTANTTIGSYATSTILVLADASAFTVDGDITSATAVGKVAYKEDNKVLVSVTSGTFAVSDAVDNANPFSAGETTVSAVFNNEALYGEILTKYAGGGALESYSTAEGEILGSDMNELSIQLFTKSVTAKTKKLKTSWTDEAEEDVMNVNKVSVAKILAGSAANQIITELNRYFITRIRNVSFPTNATGTWTYSSADGRWEAEKWKNLVSDLNLLKREVSKNNYIGQTNWCIATTELQNAFEMNGYLDTSYADPFQNVYVGKAVGMDIYTDLWAGDTVQLIGYKGVNAQTDAGFVYMPYIPFQIKSTINPTTGQPVSFYRTRFGLLDNLFGSENFFGKLTLSL